MRQRLRALRANESGFTLTELLIVIVILGILTGVVVFAVSGITNRGHTAACKADYKTVEVAVEAFYAQNTAWPRAGANGFTDLTTGGFLRDTPGNNGYVITLGADGAVSATGACTYP